MRCSDAGNPPDILWQTAAAMIRNDVGTASQPLTDDEFDHLVAVARGPEGITAESQTFLTALASPAFTLQLQHDLGSGTPFPALGMHFGDLDESRLRTIDRAVAGHQIFDLATETTPGEIAALTTMARETQVDLSSPASRLDALNQLSQHAQGADGQMSCNATSYVALATYAGPAGIAGLCDAIISEWPGTGSAATAERLKAAATTTPSALTLKDLGDLAQALYQPWERSEAAQGDTNPGVATETLHGFAQRHAEQLEPLFASGDIVGIDNYGDGHAHHAVAVLGPPDGVTAVFDPGSLKSGDHLRQGDDVEVYQRATVESLMWAARSEGH